ncbi:MAG: DNA sulfur modification protein DndD [Desulfosarcina sp.]|nr:DNA sulfur modification protein DndD [Desulfosarcina sp.]MBC2743811.1 DNA sulfur modification protein DndD [Desulfosarcina sp.]MBC2766720.1 DNA sulfur modification protein DndD [Desulfosarcina sp.]
MIFEQIRLCNMFSYYGEQVLDFQSPRKDKNILLISGRNGFGKTNFINSLKLVFAGVTEELRNVAIFGRQLLENHYLLGRGDEWLGVMNRRARLEGERDFGVEIRWREESGTIKVRRFWSIHGGKCEQKLAIRATFLNTVLKDEDAQNFIDQRLPESYIPFFFFDGEKIQQIVEAERSEQRYQIEQILNISHVETLIDHLGKTISGWQREAMEAEAKAELIKLEGDLKARRAELVENDEKRNDIQYNIDDLERDIEEEEHYLESKRAYSNQQDKAIVEQKRDALLNEIETLQINLAETLPVDLPLLANPQLVSRTCDELRKVLENEAEISNSLLTKLTTRISKDLFDTPPFPEPPLIQQQIRFLKERLVSIGAEYRSGIGKLPKSLIDIPPMRVNALLKMLDFYAGADELRYKRAADLKTLRDKKGERNEIDRRLLDASQLSEKEREEYRQRQAQNKERQDHRVDYKVELKSLEDRKRSLVTELNKKELEIKDQEERVKFTSKARERVELAKKLRSFFQNYKIALKRKYRQSIEEAINRYFHKIMSAHRLIDHIHIDENFNLHYFDKVGETVGKANLSAGMKQLSATALLWALKEVSGKTVPVVIDTPLARFDREHQENLLSVYYPNAADQVIVLPTDSELDRDKYKLLAPRIYREYRLRNNDGESTVFEEKSMYAAT